MSSQITHTKNGIKLRKYHVEADTTSPAVIYEFTSQRVEPVSVRLVESLRNGLGPEHLRFQNGDTVGDWTVRETALILECDLDMADEYETAIGLRPDVSGDLDPLISEPDRFEIASVDSVTTQEHQFTRTASNSSSTNQPGGEGSDQSESTMDDGEVPRPNTARKVGSDPTELESQAFAGAGDSASDPNSTRAWNSSGSDEPTIQAGDSSGDDESASQASETPRDDESASQASDTPRDDESTIQAGDRAGGDVPTTDASDRSGRYGPKTPVAGRSGSDESWSDEREKAGRKGVGSEMAEENTGVNEGPDERRADATTEGEATSVSEDTTGKRSLVDQLARELERGTGSSENRAYLEEIFSATGNEGSTDARIRQLQLDLADFRAYRSALEEFIDENGSAQEVLGEIESRLEATETRLNSLESTVDERAETIEDLRDTTDQFNHRLESTSATLETISNDIEGLQEDLAGLEGRVPEYDVGVRLSELEGELREVSELLGDLKMVLCEAGS